MATGFGKGWLHGVLLGGAGLVVLSLAMPLPEGSTGDETVGLAPALDVPAGSQFARGEDIAPVAPAVTEAPQANAAAVPVIAVPSEAMPLPSVASDTAARPDPAGDAPVMLPQQVAAPEESPAVTVQIADDPAPAPLPPEQPVDRISRIIEPPLVPYVLPEAPDGMAVPAEDTAATNPALTAAQADISVEAEAETDSAAASQPEPALPAAFDPSTLPDLRELMQGL